MAEMTHEEIERIWNSFSHYVPERNKLYLLKEFKEVDFFIKSNDRDLHNLIHEELLTMPMVSLVYVIPEKIMSKNLIIC